MVDGVDINYEAVPTGERCYGEDRVIKMDPEIVAAEKAIREIGNDSIIHRNAKRYTKKHGA